MNDNDYINLLISFIIMFILLVFGIIIPYANSYDYHVNEIGEITSIYPDTNLFIINNNSYAFYCQSIDVSSLSIHEVVHYIQIHKYFYSKNIEPFHVICNMTVIKP